MNRNFVRDWAMRCQMVFLVFFGAMSAFAQKPPELDHRITFTSSISDVQSKFVYEGLRSQDPNVVIHIDAPNALVLARTIVHLDRNVFQTAISPSGLVIAQMYVIGAPLPGVKSAHDSPSGDNWPTYENTGDPVQDNARYDVAKRAWIEAHPDTYQQLTAPEQER